MPNESEDDLKLMIQEMKERLAMGMFELTAHADKRLKERNMSVQDIICVGRTCYDSYLGDDDQLFHFIGVNIDASETRVVCDWEDGVLIVTVI